MLNQPYFMKKLLPASKGFTLIELMVVVTIIAFLSVIGIVAFTNAQKQARDGRRRADIEAIATALESNRTAGQYPVVNCASTTIFAGGKCPTDPDPAKSYTGIPLPDLNTFAVCAILEIPAGEKFCKYNQQ